MTPERIVELADLRRAPDFIDRHYAEPLDVLGMTEAAHMSPSHFSRGQRERFYRDALGLVTKGSIQAAIFSASARRHFEQVRASRTAEVLQQPRSQPWEAATARSEIPPGTSSASPKLDQPQGGKPHDRA